MVISNQNKAVNLSQSSGNLSYLVKSMSKISNANNDGESTGEYKNVESSKQVAKLLNAENFEEFIHDCTSGLNCEISDPWKLYLYLKRSKKTDNSELLIGFLGSQKLTNPQTRNQYKEIVKIMIEDFYPTNSYFKVAAEANYYMYLGEKTKALEMFLKLKQNYKNDRVKNISNDLNLANIYFDLKRLREALRYYESTYDEISKESQTDPNQVAVLDFVRGRISEINIYLSK